MNTLILNRETFQMPEDGWYQIAPLGEFPHQPTGVVQVVDQAACDAMTNAFKQESAKPNFAGLLIDFDHFSLDDKLKSEAAGWITGLECRMRNAERGTGSAEGLKNAQEGSDPYPHPLPSQGEGVGKSPGLWAKIRWSDLGEKAVRGGRYRFLSPVWSQRDCEDLGNGRLRPVRLLNAAVTNDPNLKGMVPLSNRRTEDGGQRTEDKTHHQPSSDCGRTTSAHEEHEGKIHRQDRQDQLDNRSTDGREKAHPASSLRNCAETPVANASASARSEGIRLKWVLGESPDDRHCPSCAALAGQVHTRADWDASGMMPGAGGLMCQGNCHCSLVETDEDVKGKLGDAPRRTPETGDGVLENAGWTDEARAASLAVRKAKADRRIESAGTGAREEDGQGEFSNENETALNELTDELRRRLREGETLAEAVQGVLGNFPENSGHDRAGDAQDSNINPVMAVAREKARLRANRATDR